MTLEQLRIFAAVAERQHVTAAARALNITQSAASAAIAALEARHEVTLFDRVGRRIELTDAGRRFLVEAHRVLAAARAAENSLDDLGDLRRGSLRLVASQTTAAYWLPKVLAAYSARYPQIALDVAIGNTAQAAVAVRRGEADLGIVEGAVDDASISQRPIADDRLLVVSAAHLPLMVEDDASLRNARWVMREAGSGTGATLRACLRRRGIDPDRLEIALVLPSNESVRTAVEAGVGIAALSELVVGPSISAGVLNASSLDLGARLFSSIEHRERQRSRATEAFLELMSRNCRNVGE